MSTPVKFMELTLQNFMSYGNNVTTINLDFSEPRLIVGKNHDAVVNGEIDSNGAGKSAILDALSFVLYDKTISNKDKASLINNINKKNMEVTLTFQKDGFQYKIVRMRKTKTKADVQFWVMGKDGEYKDKTPDSISNTNTEIERVVGLPFDVFARIIVFSATFQPFLDLPSRHASKASQTSIMEELFGYTELTDKANALKEDIKGVKAEFNHLEDLQEQIAREITRHESQIESVTERMKDWDASHVTRIQDTVDDIETLSAVDLDEERKNITALEEAKEHLREAKSNQQLHDADADTIKAKIATAEAKIEAVQEKKDNIDKVKNKVKLIEDKVDFDAEELLIDLIDELTDDLTSMASILSNRVKSIVSNSEIIAKLDEEIAHLNDSECPYCGQDFADTESKLADLNNQRTTVNNESSGFEEDVLEFKADIADKETKLDQSKNTSVIKGSRSELNKLRTQYDGFMAQVNDYTDDDVDIDELNVSINDMVDQLNSAHDAWSMANTGIQAYNDNISDLKSKCSFASLADVEKVSGKIDAATEKLETIKTEENPHSAQLKELEEITFDHDKSEKINELQDTLTHQEFLLKLLTKKDSFVRKNLLDRSLPFLNKRLMEYLSQTGLPHRVEFQGDMTASISQLGTVLDFGSLSSGQKARVNLALAFAFRDVLQSRHGKIGFCMLDECLDTGLGNVGVQLAAKMIKKIATDDKMSMFVISHRDEIASMFKSQLTVELKGGFSNIIES